MTEADVYTYEYEQRLSLLSILVRGYSGLIVIPGRTKSHSK